MNLLADIDGKSGKTPWQSYTLKHGIEALEVLVPLKNAQLFESQVLTQHPSKTELLKILAAVGGELK